MMNRRRRCDTLESSLLLLDQRTVDSKAYVARRKALNHLHSLIRPRNLHPSLDPWPLLTRGFKIRLSFRQKLHASQVAHMSSTTTATDQRGVTSKPSRAPN